MFGNTKIFRGGNQLTTRSIATLEKLTVPQINKFQAFYGTQMFITVFTTAHKLPYPEPVHASPSYFWTIHLTSILPPTPRSLSFWFPHQHPVWTSSPYHKYHIPHLSHSSRFDHPNNVWKGVQITKLLTAQSPPLPCALDPLRPKQLPQHLILKHPQPRFPPQCKRPTFMPTWNNRQNHSSDLFNLHIFQYFNGGNISQNYINFLHLKSPGYYFFLAHSKKTSGRIFLLRKGLEEQFQDFKITKP